jgi:hypothetical protein
LILGIPPRYTREEALAFFRRPRWGTLFGLLRPSLEFGADADPSRKARLETVHLPYYLIRFGVDSSKGPGTIDVSVEALSGSFALFDMHKNLVEYEPEGEVFAPRLPEREAAARGQEELVKSILRRRGNREKPSVGEMESVKIFYYPYWILIYPTRKRAYNLFVFDAARGEKAGSRTRVGILAGLAGSDTALQARILGKPGGPG